MEFSERLKELRQGKGISQTRLASDIHISRSAVAKWENGLGLPNDESLRMLAEYFEITVDDDFNGELFIAGARLENGKILTAGGRVLGVTCCADTLEDAVKMAYIQADKVHFENAYRRNDIGKKALAALK